MTDIYPGFDSIRPGQEGDLKHIDRHTLAEEAEEKQEQESKAKLE